MHDGFLEAEQESGDRLHIDCIIRAELDGLRADLVLARLLGADWSRSRIKRLCCSLTRNGQAIKLSEKFAGGDRLEAELDDSPGFADLKPEAIPLDIVHEDDELIVINKPWGMAVHPSPGTPGATVVNALLAHCKTLPASDPLRPGIVHRLDKDTSGLLVCAKTERARIALAEDFQQRRVKKQYAALVRGRISPRQGIIEAPLGRDPVHRTRQAVIANGREARTDYRVSEEFSNHSLLDITLHTGRTHQIRVHLSWKGHPIVGDPIYSRSDTLSERLCLAAVRLGLVHPVRKTEMEWSVPLPEHMQRALARLRAGAEA